MQTIKNFILKHDFKKAVWGAVAVTTMFWLGVWQLSIFVENTRQEIWQEGYEVGRFDQLNESAAQNEEARKQASIDQKKAILHNLAKIESVNGKYRKILDTNNKYSLGLYHFQATTVKDMYRRYYKKNITIDEAVEIAYDDKLATQLAWDAIFVKGEKYHWHNSMIKLSKKGIIVYN